MTVRISTALRDRIIGHAAADPGREVCGLLFGAAEAILDAIPATNVAAEPALRFEIDPAALFAAIRAERRGGPALIGHYHSHPTGLPAPSPCDAAEAGDPGRLWLIAAGGQVAAFRAVSGGPIHGTFEPVALVIADTGMRRVKPIRLQLPPGAARKAAPDPKVFFA